MSPGSSTEEEQVAADIAAEWRQVVLPVVMERPRDRPRARAGERDQPQGTFWSVSTVNPRQHLRAVGCICRLHVDLADGGARGRCKKTINLGEGLDVASATDMLKRWILIGADETLASNGTFSRSEHRGVNPRERCVDGASGRELDGCLEDVEAQLLERNFLQKKRYQTLLQCAPCTW